MKNIIDITKLIDNHKFEENNKNIFSKINDIRKECDDLHRITNEFNLMLNMFASKESLNSYKNNMDICFLN